MKKTLYRSVFTLEVISPDPIPDNWFLGDIVSETVDGEYTGNINTTALNEVIKGKDAVDAVKNQGTDPEFFFMDDDGNEIEEE